MSCAETGCVRAESEGRDGRGVNAGRVCAGAGAERARCGAPVVCAEIVWVDELEETDEMEEIDELDACECEEWDAEEVWETRETREGEDIADTNEDTNEEVELDTDDEATPVGGSSPSSVSEPVAERESGERGVRDRSAAAVPVATAGTDVSTGAARFANGSSERRSGGVSYASASEVCAYSNPYSYGRRPAGGNDHDVVGGKYGGNAPTDGEHGAVRAARGRCAGAGAGAKKAGAKMDWSERRFLGRREVLMGGVGGTVGSAWKRVVGVYRSVGLGG